MAATGLLGATLWFGGTWLLLTTGTSTEMLGFFFGIGLFFLLPSILASFFVGVVLWRTLYSDSHRRLCGAVFGGITALSSLVAGALGLAAFLAAANVRRGEMALLEAIVFAILLVPVGFLFAVVAAGWLIVPLGVFGGWYHERTKTAP